MHELTPPELAIARRMVQALDPLGEADPDGDDPIWLSTWWGWFYEAWNGWRGGRPAVLTPLVDRFPPSWMP